VELNQIFNSAADGMCLISKEFEIMRVNETYEKLFGLHNRSLAGQKCHAVFPGPACHSDDCPLTRIQAGENRVEIECVKEHADGTPIPVIITATPFLGKDGGLIGIIEDYKDITDRKQLEARLHEISITDELTGLLNRRGFLTMAEKQLIAASGGSRQIYLLYADLDNMKWINDTFGHKMGDQALIETTAILKTTFRNADVIGRLGGDEFVVLLSETSIQDRGQAIISRFEEAIRKRNETPKNKEFVLQVSLGISQYDPARPCSLEDLLTRADARMYECKNSRKNQVHGVLH
jgi:diguanylate cyclase (GGDEF)-like protein/PAS domain S-box-containing protein